VRVVNTSDKPFEFMFNATSFGPYQPGQIVDLPDEVALHGIKRSTMYDSESGGYLGQKLEPLDAVKVDPMRMQQLITYDCPLAESDQCNAKGFKSLDDLRVHMEQAHWGKPEVDDPLAPIVPASTKASNASASSKK